MEPDLFMISRRQITATVSSDYNVGNRCLPENAIDGIKTLPTPQAEENTVACTNFYDDNRWLQFDVGLELPVGKVTVPYRA